MIKKILLLGIILIEVLTGCTTKEEKVKKEINVEKQPEDFVDPYVDDNPIELGLYQNQNNTRTLVTTYESNFSENQDIISLEVYYTKEETFTGKQKDLWQQYYQNYQDIDNYKIGYHIAFETTTEVISQNILTPDDTGNIFHYIQLYLYDDINQGEGFYSHITQSEMTDETILTSIKLTTSSDINNITSPITLTAFTYDSDDFNELEEYRGSSSYQVIIKRK